MNRRKSGLGSGLDALFSAQPQVENRAALRDVAIGDVRPNLRQPRTQFDQTALEELAASIREHGLIQPLIVSSSTEGYELIAGERRWRAAQLAGLTSIPVIVREAAPQQLLELALIENVQRADLNPLEEARAYQSLVDDFGMTDGEIARRMGKGSREAIANMRRLLQLDSAAQAAVLLNQISAGHGRAILKLKEPELQRALLDTIRAEELSVRAAERMADLIAKHGGDVAAALGELRGITSSPQRQPGKPSAAPGSMSAALSADDDAFRRTLERQLGTPVTFTRTDKELRITIAFHSEEKLQEFFELVSRGE